MAAFDWDQAVKDIYGDDMKTNGKPYRLVVETLVRAAGADGKAQDVTLQAGDYVLPRDEIQTLRDVVVAALMQQRPSEPGAKAAKRGRLAIRVQTATAETTFGSNAIIMMKDDVRQFQPPLVVARAEAILDPDGGEKDEFDEDSK